jgi:hypothetical protein
MKNIRGNYALLILLFLCSFSGLSANELANYSLKSSTTNPYLKEAVEISFSAEQKESSDVMFFFLEPKKSSDYKITLLKKESTELAYHHKKTTFHYLLFPLKSGEVKVAFDFIIKQASDEAVAEVYEGGRDNVKWIETDNTHIELDPLVLDVKKIADDVVLVGDFRLESSIDKEQVDAYESVNVKYKLTGVGFDEFQLKLIQESSNYNLFEELTKHYNKATKEGYKIEQEYNYAILAKESFSIKAQTIRCFLPKEKRYYTLKTKAYNVTVTPLPKEEILDSEEYPKVDYFYEKVQSFFIYLLIFAAGYMSAKIAPKRKKEKREAFLDLKKANNAKEMLALLTNKYATYKQLYPFHKELEDLLYSDKKRGEFSTIKSALLKRLKELE